VKVAINHVVLFGPD